MPAPAYGDEVSLIGLLNTSLLQPGEVGSFEWSVYYERLVTYGYVAIYTGPIVPPSRPPSFSDTSVADLVAASSAATRAAVEARVRAVGDATYASLANLARNPDLLIAGSITRDANNAATSAPVVWPDGTPGTYTATTVSTAFPGAVDAYTVTYGSPVTKTFTQPAVTRNAAGAATAVPAIVVS